MGTKITIFGPMLQRFFIVILGFTLLASSCATKAEESSLKEGDLLFQDLDCGPMCNAIEAVTEGVNGRDFSHCAIVIKEHDSLKVIEAIGSAVQITSLSDFLKRSNKVLAARLKTSDNELISRAVKYSKSLEGKPYDDVFLMNNGAYYCSELLYESFMVANDGKPIFSLAPMTFKDPETHDFYPVWVEYYHELHCRIPEGKPGLNPGSVSRSEKLELLDVEIKP